MFHALCVAKKFVSMKNALNKVKSGSRPFIVLQAAKKVLKRFTS
jgi:hypothetical protein